MELVEKLRLIFIQNIKREAERLKLDYKDIADRAGLSRSGIYKIMQGLREPGFDNIERIAGALGVSPHSLVTAPGERPKPSATEVLEVVAAALQSSGKTHSDDARLNRIQRVLQGNEHLADVIMGAVEEFEAASKEPVRSSK